MVINDSCSVAWTAGCVPGEAGRAGAIGRVGAGQSDHGAADLQH